jgi:Arc/MetJ-type ribon-helix-helix transcriptional regulator
MTVELPDDIRAAIDAAVRSGRYPSAGDAITAAWRSFEGHGEAATVPAGAPPTTSPPPFWEAIEAENRAIPTEVWDALPADLSDQHDHYVYGTPRKRAG